jgi:predicted nuclease with TOPRIM domain
MAEVTLEFLGEQMSRLFGEVRRLDGKLDRLQADVGRLQADVTVLRDDVAEVRDELLVTSGIVLRLEAREVETAGLKALYDRLARRVAKLEGGEPA